MIAASAMAANGTQEQDGESCAKRQRVASPASPLRVGLVGLGAIGGHVARELCDGASLPGARLAVVLVHRQRESRPEGVGTEALVTTDVDAFFAAEWDVCVEAAGQLFVREHGKRVLEAGRSLLLTSIGVLTDDALHDELVGLASRFGGRLLIAAGAMPGMDWMSSAALEEVTEITLEQRKRPDGWRGTPAEEKLDLSAVTEPTVVFEGPAREASSRFPKNANISAALALATVGLDRLVVRLLADPTVSGPSVSITFRGVAGEMTIKVKGAALSQRTSRVVPLSVVKALKNLSSPEVIGV